MNNAIKVLVVDDSALVRKLLREILETDPALEVVGTANDPYDAREKIKSLSPDVLTLDVEMPKMDGITFLGNLMRLHPMPVVMVSSLTEKGAETTLQALELGAIDFVSKPKIDLQHSLEHCGDEIISKLKIAAKSKVKTLTRNPLKSDTNKAVKLSSNAVNDGVSQPNKTVSKSLFSDKSVIVIGASTGGTEAIKNVLLTMPENSPAVLITQHIPAAFSAPFSKRMDGICAMPVCEAQDDQEVLPGHVYIAPGDRHLMLVKKNGQYRCKLNAGPEVNRHKPSVDVLFSSAGKCAGKEVICALLTGMGDDGARGMKELQDLGAKTIAQDKESSVVWGMPGAAVKLDAADKIVPLDKVVEELLSKKVL